MERVKVMGELLLCLVVSMWSWNVQPQNFRINVAVSVVLKYPSLQQGWETLALSRVQTLVLLNYSQQDHQLVIMGLYCRHIWGAKASPLCMKNMFACTDVELLHLFLVGFLNVSESISTRMKNREEIRISTEHHILQLNTFWIIRPSFSVAVPRLEFPLTAGQVGHFFALLPQAV